nr:hypothetical protein [Gammaproteobacteria bacterium]
MRELGVDPDTFLSTLTFVSDANAATFLQQVRGIEAMGRFSRETLPLWAWQARWFRSEEVEEYRLRLAPDGRPLRFRHTIPEAAGGDSLPQDSALAIASRFVSG